MRWIARLKNYVRRLWQQPPVEPGCPLCWDNRMLRGGRVLAMTRLLFCYVFSNEDTGEFKYALLVSRHHYASLATLPSGWGEEFGALYSQVLTLMKGAPHNGYWNYGYVAGVRIEGHVHVRVEPRHYDEPAAGMGLGLLVARLNSLVAGIDALAAQCADPAMAAKLRELSATATVK